MNADARMTRRLDMREACREWRDRQLDRLGLERKISFSGRVSYVPKAKPVAVMGVDWQDFDGGDAE